jgi:chromosome segregation ATPase
MEKKRTAKIISTNEAEIKARFIEFKRCSLVINDLRNEKKGLVQDLDIVKSNLAITNAKFECLPTQFTRMTPPSNIEDDALNKVKFNESEPERVALEKDIKAKDQQLVELTKEAEDVKHAYKELQVSFDNLSGELRDMAFAKAVAVKEVELLRSSSPDPIDERCDISDNLDGQTDQLTAARLELFSLRSETQCRITFLEQTVKEQDEKNIILEDRCSARSRMVVELQDIIAVAHTAASNHTSTRRALALKTEELSSTTRMCDEVVFLLQCQILSASDEAGRKKEELDVITRQHEELMGSLQDLSHKSVFKKATKPVERKDQRSYERGKVGFAARILKSVRGCLPKSRSP